MPRPRDPVYDTREFRLLWFSPATLSEIGRRFDKTPHAVWSAARKRGFPRRRFAGLGEMWRRA